MARRQGDRHEASPPPDTALVYKPCPACGRAVLLSPDARVAEEPETYECPHCGARFYLTETMP